MNEFFFLPNISYLEVRLVLEFKIKWSIKMILYKIFLYWIVFPGLQLFLSMSGLTDSHLNKKKFFSKYMIRVFPENALLNPNPHFYCELNWKYAGVVLYSF